VVVTGEGEVATEADREDVEATEDPVGGAAVAVGIAETAETAGKLFWILVACRAQARISKASWEI
jgi:hypothetical protein